MSTTPRGERTRRLIVEKTAAVFRRRGFAAASLTQLVESTGLTRGAFYFHFPSKDALAVAIAEAQAERWHALREEVERTETRPLHRLIELNLRALALYQRDDVVRAAARLLTERAVIRGHLPETFSARIAIIEQYLRDADAAGYLKDLSHLTRPGTPDPHERGRRAFAEHLIAVWAALPTAGAGVTGPVELTARVYTLWAMLLPTLCRSEELARELLARIEEFATAQQTLQATAR